MSGLGTIGKRIQEGSLYVLLFLLPFSKAAIEITFGLLLIGWLMARFDPATRAESVWGRRALRPLALSLVGYLAVCALSITVSDYPALSVRAWFSKWLEYLLFCVIVADVACRRGVATRCLVVFSASALCVLFQVAWQEIVLYARVHRVFGLSAWAEHPIFYYRRTTGPYSNPADLATYLMVLIPLGLTSIMRTRGRSRLVYSGLLLLLVLCLGRTSALGAWIGLAAGLVVFMARSDVMRRYGLVLLIGGVVTLGGFVHVGGGRLNNILSPSEVGKVDRVVMWQAAIGMIRDRPILGHGLNTFMANYLDYWVGGERQPRYAHNCYLQVWAETGILGLIMFLMVLGLLFARLFSGLRRIRSDDTRLMLLGCVAGLVAFAVHASVDTNFYSLRQATLFWVLSGLALGISEQVTDTV